MDPETDNLIKQLEHFKALSVLLTERVEMINQRRFDFGKCERAPLGDICHIIDKTLPGDGEEWQQFDACVNAAANKDKASMHITADSIIVNSTGVIVNNLDEPSINRSRNFIRGHGGYIIQRGKKSVTLDYIYRYLIAHICDLEPLYGDDGISYESLAGFPIAIPTPEIQKEFCMFAIRNDMEKKSCLLSIAEFAEVNIRLRQHVGKNE